MSQQQRYSPMEKQTVKNPNLLLHTKIALLHKWAKEKLVKTRNKLEATANPLPMNGQRTSTRFILKYTREIA